MKIAKNRAKSSSWERCSKKFAVKFMVAYSYFSLLTVCLIPIDKSGSNKAFLKGSSFFIKRRFSWKMGMLTKAYSKKKLRRIDRKLQTLAKGNQLAQS